MEIAKFLILEFSSFSFQLAFSHISIGKKNRSRDSSVGMSLHGKEIFLYPTVSRPTLGLLTGIKRQGRKADHSPPSTVGVKNGKAISPLPHTSSSRGT
jgi:hypothetical protein